MRNHAASSSRYYFFHGYGYLAATYLMLWEHRRRSADQALLADQAQQAYQDLAMFRHFSALQPRRQLYEGWIASLTGDHTRADRLWRRAAAEADAMGMTYDRGLIAETAGRLSEGPRRKELQAEAEGIFSALRDTIPGV